MGNRVLLSCIHTHINNGGRISLKFVPMKIKTFPYSNLIEKFPIGLVRND
jgi:hypothetical protein